MKNKIGYELKGTCKELTDLKGPEYQYLGHFAKKKFQDEGHNFMKKQKASNILGAVSSGIANIGATMIRASALSEDKEPEEPKEPKTISAPATPSTIVPGAGDFASDPKNPADDILKKKAFGGALA